MNRVDHHWPFGISVRRHLEVKYNTYQLTVWQGSAFSRRLGCAFAWCASIN